jgi:integrase
MARQKKDIRTNRRADRGGQCYVAFIENPGSWYATPYFEEPQAIAWAKRNRSRLLAASSAKLKTYLGSFFDSGADWATRCEARGQHIGAGYLATRRSILNKWILPLWGEEEPAKLTARRVEDDLIPLPLAGATKNKIASTLSIILADLAAQGVIDRNPMASMARFSRAPVTPRVVLSREDLARAYPVTHGELIQVWGSAMWGALFCLFNDTGIRPGEARALRWSDWWPEDRFLPIRHGIEAGTKATIKGLKTEHEGIVARPAFVSKRTKQELEIWHAETKWGGPNDFIFTASGAAPVDSASIVKAFRRGLKNAKIEGDTWTPYNLRHSFGTYALEAIDDDGIFKLMGHTNIATNSVYRHPDDLTLLRNGIALRDQLDAMREPKITEFRKKTEA